MSDTSIDRGKARLLARGAQALAGLLVVSGVGAAMVLPRETELPEVADPLENLAEDVQRLMADQGTETTGDDGPGDLPPDWEGIAARFELVSGIEKKVEPPPKPTGGDGEDGGTTTTLEDPGPETPPVPSSVVRYLGRIMVGSSPVALVSVDGSQAFIAEGNSKSVSTGDERVEVKVVSVTEDELEFTEDGVERTVERAERRSTAVSVAVEPDPKPAARPASRGTPPENRRANITRSVNQNPLDREQFRRDDGTIDYEALRQAARERRDQIEAQRIRNANERGQDRERRGQDDD